MEKRLFLAIGLSLMVVWLWSFNAPKPKNFLRNPEQIQPSEIKQDTTSTAPSPALPLAQNEASDININEKLEQLNTEKLSVEISNIGASLNEVTLNDYTTALPIEQIAGFSGYEQKEFSRIPSEKGSSAYSYEDDNIKIVRTFSLGKQDYLIETKTVVFNKSDTPRAFSPKIDGYLMEMSSLDISKKSSNISKSRDRALLEYVVYSEKGIHRKAGAYKFSEKEQKEEPGKVFWGGVRDRYFCAIVKPHYNTVGYSINPIGEHQLKVTFNAEEITIPAQGTATYDSTIYVGPEEMGILKGYRMGFEKIKKYYRFSLFDGIAKIISGMMHMLYRFIPNWGVCIIIISVVVYFSMYPLTLRGMLSMKKMQSIQPMIVQLKEKYKDNPQRMNKEMMELYKKHKVNPLGGCLPMLLQMPVFIGLYQVLWRSVSFKGAKFLWIKDLSQPDRLFIFPFSLPFLGNEFNILPIIMIVVMFVQQKITSKNMASTDPAQIAQQKMMTTIMPLFLGFIFYKFASGLTLYFTMFYLFSTFTQWKMSKINKGA